MQYRTINKKNARQNWGAQITESTGIKSDEKLQWMSEMLTINENMLTLEGGIINESYGSQGPEAVPGMGAVKLPSVSQNASGILNQTGRGSGDFAQRALAMSLNVAAYTIGLELLPIIPMEFPSIMFGYLDHVYASRFDTNKASQGSTEIFIQLEGDLAGYAKGAYSKLQAGDKVFLGHIPTAGATALAGHNVSNVPYGTFLGKHRVNGEPIIRWEGAVSLTGVGATGAVRTYTLSSISDIAPNTALKVASGAGYEWALIKGTAGGTSETVIDASNAIQLTDQYVAGDNKSVSGDLVSAVDMHIPEFSKPGASYDGKEDLKATRERGEKGTQNIISLRLFSTSVEAGTIEVLAEITKTQLRDLMAYGQDGMGQLYKSAQNELSQTLNDDILRTMFKLGVTSHVKLKNAQGLNLNLLFSDPGTTANKALTAFGTKKFVDINDVDRTAEFGNIPTVDANTSSENYGSRARRLATRILYASNVINTVGRHGGGNFIVTNTTVATALQEAKGYRELALDNDLFVNNVNLYQVGTLHGGIRVYVDPKMSFTDNRILVGRKGTEQDPGLKLFVYALAESIETISESSMSPKICITSRYALVPAGMHAEAQYLTFAVNNEFGMA
ncbi:major capsid protein [Tenacibaculum phage PTm1]|uniref:Major capsid protein n=2 Tax=Shirahamavirus PTm1 TaxID=2846435 RepID=A0A5S9HXL4_9CAUD|nr:major capsid protein [Tenacibaculum phage PTm1]BBI90693.1 major capsid protein [Tenacibaculum phage PTm1]BBI91000.1 major capsid protein [Tenacibaculum phage PTm5]